MIYFLSSFIEITVYIAMKFDLPNEEKLELSWVGLG